MDIFPHPETHVVVVDPSKIGTIALTESYNSLDDWDITLNKSSEDAQSLQAAAKQLRESDIPVAFPTETVYGLGADATRSSAVKGIYKAKQRPSDNPLIVHFASLRQLRAVLKPSDEGRGNGQMESDDPIPSIYKSLIERFWPGPLTIILRNPENSVLAPEVTAGLTTFGARMPRNILALALIKLADRPIAAPSANASTKPSPTAAEHVAYDLDGRIETIIDGGPCDVGVESTVVDGLSTPPTILRPGGISIEQLRECSGWEQTAVAYKDVSEKGTKPKAPGMKYRHYSPKATVVLYENDVRLPTMSDVRQQLKTGQTGSHNKVGIVRTKFWEYAREQNDRFVARKPRDPAGEIQKPIRRQENCAKGFAGLLQSLQLPRVPEPKQLDAVDGVSIWDIELGPDTLDVARGLFSALRALDQLEVDAILVEGIEDVEGDVAAAVMNRLRKAAEVKMTE